MAALVLAISLRKAPSCLTIGIAGDEPGDDEGE
jgi:hypothetical protein